MLALMALTSLTALLFIYIFMPTLWASMMAIDESLDRHESGIALVASRKLCCLTMKRSGPTLRISRESIP